jgi:hypothetical protein
MIVAPHKASWWLLEFFGRLMKFLALVRSFDRVKPYLLGGNLIDGPCRRLRRFGFLGYAGKYRP